MKFEPGEIVKINPKKCWSPENLMLLSGELDKFKLHEIIDIHSYPSCNDFKGYSNLFKKEYFIIIEKKGRPTSFSNEKQWELYDVYKVLYCDKIYECFSYCFDKIN